MPTVPFPILRLPNAILHNSLQQMSPIGLISLSVLSNNMKQLVTRLNNRNRFEGSIETTSPISLKMHPSLPPYIGYAFEFNQSVLRIQASRERQEIESATLTKPGFTEKLWIEHVVEVLLHNKGVALDFDDPFQSNIKEILKKINISWIGTTFSEYVVWKFLEMFPSLDEVTFYEGPIPVSILSRNFNLLHINTTNATLDYALTLNCSIFSMYINSFTMKEINLFIKQWIRGCNPRLEMFQILGNDNERHLASENIIFKGINIEKRNRIVHFHEREEYRIERFDGAEALVWINLNSTPFLWMAVQQVA